MSETNYLTKFEKKAHIVKAVQHWRVKSSGGAKRVGVRGPYLYRGGNFARKCISTIPIGAPIDIYLAPGGNTPCSATGEKY